MPNRLGDSPIKLYEMTIYKNTGSKLAKPITACLGCTNVISLSQQRHLIGVILDIETTSNQDRRSLQDGHFLIALPFNALRSGARYERPAPQGRTAATCYVF